MRHLKPPVLTLLAVVGIACAEAGNRPNILIVQTDEHNFRTLGCYRELMAPEQAFVWGDGVKVETPNIDWLAKNGAICDRFYATSPVCTPSRAALVSGRYPQNTGAISNNHPLSDDVETFAQVCADNGYATGYAGKWHLDGPAKPGWAPARKFGFDDNRYQFNRGHWKKLTESKDGPRVASLTKGGAPSYGLDGADEKTFTTDFLTDRTIAFIEENRDKPFCYMLAIPDPHGPNTVRAPYDTMFDPADFSAPRSAGASGRGLPTFASVIESRFNARQMALYFGMVKCIDDNIGRILDTLRTHEILDDTIVVFTSDHGDMCGEKGRHNKGIPCEGSARIPFVLYSAGDVRPGTVLHEAMGTVDFKPTILDLAGLETTQEPEGRNLAPLFRMGKAPDGWDDTTFVRIGDGDGKNNWMGAFTKRYKLVVSPSTEPAFFDLSEDPDELTNHFSTKRYLDDRKRLAAALQRYAADFGDPLIQSAPVASALLRAAQSAP